MPIVIGTGGFDISTLDNIGSDLKRFDVYKHEVVASGNRRQPRKYQRQSPNSQRDGYFLTGSTLLLTPKGRTENVIISYQTKTTRVSSSDSLSSQLLLLDQDMEQTVIEYIKFVFYDGQYQFDKKQEAEDRFLEELKRFFSFPAVTYNIY